jgi:hypothetical protein
MRIMSRQLYAWAASLLRVIATISMTAVFHWFIVQL